MKRTPKARKKTTKTKSAQLWSQQQIKGVTKQSFIGGREEERDWQWGETGGERNTQATRRKKKICHDKMSKEREMVN